MVQYDVALLDDGLFETMRRPRRWRRDDGCNHRLVCRKVLLEALGQIQNGGDEQDQRVGACCWV
jgi:hypothetical protein